MSLSDAKVKLKRPPLTDIQARLKILARRELSEVNACVVIFRREDGSYTSQAFGDVRNRDEIDGIISAALRG